MNNYIVCIYLKDVLVKSILISAQDAYEAEQYVMDLYSCEAVAWRIED